MDWNGIFRPPHPFLSESSSPFLYNYYNLDNHCPESLEIEMKHGAVEGRQGAVSGVEKKKRLSNDQLEVLERSFGEEVKLDPDRKMKLSKQLGLQPRQIAVWFQNRRARWKAKQLEHLYDTLKQEFDTISKEKNNLQQEVMKLRSMLIEQAARNQGSAADASGEETVESTSVGARSCCNNYIYNVAEDFNQISASASASASASPFWGAAHHLPSYP